MKHRPLIMGILNVTPDSFSGDGQLERAPVQAAARMAAAGAQIIDIGAESTRPDAAELTADAEWARLAPVLSAVARQPWRDLVRLSVDTRHPATAERSLAMGVDILNDVTSLAAPELLQMLSARTCDIVVMHALSVPVVPQLTLPTDCDVVQEMLRWKAAQVERAKAHGIAAERLVFDPGIGFGKTAGQSLDLMLRASELVASGGRWLYGHSRKSFMKLFTNAEAAARDDMTLAFSAQLAHAGVHWLRVHEVSRHVAVFNKLQAGARR
jgi:dihydropteroate synthase